MGEIRCTLKQAQDGVAVPLDEATTIIVVPAVAQVTLKGRAFDAGKAFLLPRAAAALNEVFAFGLRLQAAHALVVAHVDATDAEVDKLSEMRSKVAAAWLSGDPAPWTQQYGDSVPADARWGAREDRYLLSAAMSGAGELPRVEGASGDPLVRAFQTLAQIKVDGIIGPQTRGKLVEKYFSLTRAAKKVDVQPSEKGIAKLPTEVKAHAAGAHFTLQQVASTKKAHAFGSAATKPNAGPLTSTAPKPSEAPEDGPEESNARVDFLFFFHDSGPDPAPGAADGPEFMEWVKQAELERVVQARASGAGTTLFVELWDKDGVTRHKGQKYSIQGPEAYSGVTSALGRIEHDDVIPGDYTLALTLEFFEGADRIVDQYQASLVTQSTADSPQVRLLGAVPGCDLCLVRGLLFDTNKAFLVPEAITPLKNIRRVYEEHNGCELLIVGHTDTTGTPSTNDPLSLERAKATLAYLQDDVDTWLSFYEPSVPFDRRWGNQEDDRMREHVGDASLERRELIAAYMALDGVELDAAEFSIKATAHGCGENFPLNERGDEIDNSPQDEKEDQFDRRVELFFFEPDFGIVPAPRGEISKKGSTQYPAWRKLARTVSDNKVGPVIQQFVHSI